MSQKRDKLLHNQGIIEGQRSPSLHPLPNNSCNTTYYLGIITVIVMLYFLVLFQLVKYLRRMLPHSRLLSIGTT